MRFLPLIGISVLIWACNDKESQPVDTSPEVVGGDDTYVIPTDADGDGYAAEDDCDDNDADIHPGQPENCDGVDENCNGVVDEGFGDADSDGIADCIDSEECDGQDNDGDGDIDEDFADDDGDGIADCLGTEECNGEDDDGDGQIDEGFDADGDGYTSCGGDCDDSDYNINPGETETAGDLIDNDCDELIDEGSWAEGQLLITEVMVNPDSVSDPAGEWIELYNLTNQTLILNGLVIGSDLDGQSHQIVSDDLITVASHAYIVIGTNKDSASNGGVEIAYQYADVSHSNENDEIYIKADGVTLDQVDWDDGVSMPDPTGATIQLDPDYYDTTLNDLPIAWCQGKYEWAEGSDLGTPGEANYVCRPEAVASYDPASSLYTCDDLTLDATGSNSGLGLTLDYEWELAGAPSSSDKTSSDIITTTDAQPIFEPDVPGNYTFCVTVDDGYEASVPDCVTITITERPYNNDPVADAGPDQAYSEAATCWPVSYGAYYTCSDCGDHEFILDGTNSGDMDGDWFTYYWTITGNASYASIVDEDTDAPTVTVTGVPTTYGSSNTVTVEVTLTITDCMGAEASDTVDLTYTCKGS
jgi:hypothetical protein